MMFVAQNNLMMQELDFLGASVASMAEFAQENIVIKVRGNAGDSKNSNVALTRISSNADVENKEERSHPTHWLQSQRTHTSDCKK